MLGRRPAPTALDPDSWIALQRCLGRRARLGTAKQHVLVTRQTKSTQASASYLSHILDPADVRPKLLRGTRLAQLVTIMDPKLVSAAFGMRAAPRGRSKRAGHADAEVDPGLQDRITASPRAPARAGGPQRVPPSCTRTSARPGSASARPMPAGHIPGNSLKQPPYAGCVAGPEQACAHVHQPPPPGRGEARRGTGGGEHRVGRPATLRSAVCVGGVAGRPRLGWVARRSQRRGAAGRLAEGASWDSVVRMSRSAQVTSEGGNWSARCGMQDRLNSIRARSGSAGGRAAARGCRGTAP